MKQSLARSYVVEKIVDEKVVKGKTLYKVKWVSYSSDQNTWEPIENLDNCNGKLEEWRQRKGKPQAQKDGSKTITNRASQIRNLKRRSSSPSSNTSKKVQKKNQDVVRIAIDQTRSHPDRLSFQAKLDKLSGAAVTLVNKVDNVPCPPLHLNIVEENVFHQDVTPPSTDFMWGCECGDDCIDDNCLCIEQNAKDDLTQDQFFYNKNGVLRMPSENRFVIHECNDKCSCGPKCRNRVTGRGRQLPIEIFKTETKGWGLRCPQPIKAGTFIDKYVGEIITDDEATKRHNDNEANGAGLSYIFNLDKYRDDEELALQAIYAVDGANIGGITRFINHSCAPNVMIHCVTRNRANLAFYDIAMFACEDIEANEELTFAYSGLVEGSDNEDEEGGEEAYVGGNGDVKKRRRRGRLPKANGKNGSLPPGISKKQRWPCHCGAEECRGWLWVN